MAPVRASLSLRIRGWLAKQDIMRLAALVAIAAFLADSASKAWALAAFADAATTLIPEHNNAFAFSAGAGSVETDVVIGARLLMLAAVGVLFGRLVVDDRRSAAGLGLILGGGFGNAADVAFRGAVVDFIPVGPFTFDWVGQLLEMHFVLNVADFAILIGIGMMAPQIRSCAVEAQRRIGEWEARVTSERRLFL